MSSPIINIEEHFLCFHQYDFFHSHEIWQQLPEILCTSPIGDFTIFFLALGAPIGPHPNPYRVERGIKKSCLYEIFFIRAIKY
jgi:hypothetical protein